MNKTSHASPPFVSIFPQRRLLCVNYGRNSIFISLHKALPPEYEAHAENITGQQLPFIRDGIPIHGNGHHNRIVASYYPEINQLIILHCRHIYSVNLPPYIKRIHCQ